MTKLKPLRPIEDVIADATRILNREPGVVDTIRLITHYRPGTGDGVAEKHAREDAEDAAAENPQSQPLAVSSVVTAAAG